MTQSVCVVIMYFSALIFEFDRLQSKYVRKVRHHKNTTTTRLSKKASRHSPCAFINMAVYSRSTPLVFVLLLLFLIIHAEEQSMQTSERVARYKRLFWPFFPFLTPPTQPSTTRTTTRASWTSGTTRSTTRSSTTNRPSTRSSTSATTSTTGSTGFTNFQIQALSRTNGYRLAHCAPPLKNNASLTTIAQRYANTLAAKRSFQHSNNGYGENLYMFSSSVPININTVDGMQTR